jgi:hypothetical protein
MKDGEMVIRNCDAVCVKMQKVKGPEPGQRGHRAPQVPSERPRRRPNRAQAPTTKGRGRKPHGPTYRRKGRRKTRRGGEGLLLRRTAMSGEAEMKTKMLAKREHRSHLCDCMILRVQVIKDELTNREKRS